MGNVGFEGYYGGRSWEVKEFGMSVKNKSTVIYRHIIKMMRNIYICFVILSHRTIKRT